MKSINLVLPLALAMPLMASAAEWVTIGHNEDVTLLVDVNSFSRGDSRVKMWVKSIYQQPRSVSSAYPYKMFDYLLEHFVIDCGKATLVTAQQMAYSNANGGQLVNSVRVDETKWSFSAPIPDSGDDFIYNYACPKSFKRP